MMRQKKSLMASMTATITRAEELITAASTWGFRFFRRLGVFTVSSTPLDGDWQEWGRLMFVMTVLRPRTQVVA